MIVPDKRVSTLDELVEAREKAREVLRELHGMLKDVKRTQSAIEQYYKNGAEAVVVTCLNAAMDKYTEMFRIHLEHVVDSAVGAITTRGNAWVKSLEEREQAITDTVTVVQDMVEQLSDFLDKHRKGEWVNVESLAKGDTGETTAAHD